MASYGFFPLQRVAFEDREYVIDCVVESLVQLQDIRIGLSRPVPRTELEQAFLDGRLRFAPSASPMCTTTTAPTPPKQRPFDLATVPGKDLAVAQRRAAYVRGCMKINPIAWRPPYLAAEIKRIHARIGDQLPPPSESAVCDWHRRYERSGGILEALIPRHRRKGNTERRHDPRLYNWAWEVLESRWLRPERPPLTHAHRHLEGVVLSHNKANPSDVLPIPSRDFLRRLSHQIPAAVRDKARYGSDYVRKRYRVAGGGLDVSRAGERYEFDHTPGNFLVLDDVSLIPFGTLNLTYVIDAHSRHIPGFYLGFEPPSDLSCLGCLRHAILPKTDLKQRNPLIVNVWECAGICEELVLDNDLPHLGKALEDSCGRLDMTIHLLPVRHPWLKPKIERFFGTLASQVMNVVPGTTFANYLARLGYDSTKYAVIRFSTAVKLIEKWVVDIYSQENMEGLFDCPARIWARSCAEYPMRLPPSRQFVDIVLGKVTADALLNFKGIKLNGARYNSPALGALRRQFGDELKVFVKWYPDDADRINVLHPDGTSWIEARSVRPRDTAGLSVQQYRAIRRFRNIMSEDLNRKLEIHEARAAFEKMIRDDMAVGGQRRTRKRHARLLNIGTNDRPHSEAEVITQGLRILDTSDAAAPILGHVPETRVPGAATPPRPGSDGDVIDEGPETGLVHAGKDAPDAATPADVRSFKIKPSI